MESLMEMTPETESASPTAPIWQDVLAQAVTGEHTLATLASGAQEHRNGGDLPSGHRPSGAQSGVITTWYLVTLYVF